MFNSLVNNLILEENNIDFPQEFIELFARYLDAGSSLEPSLPPTIGNVSRELG